jgi:hypothetical protein
MKVNRIPNHLRVPDFIGLGYLRVPDEGQ